jgi:Ca2+-binding EF-hand superfamily protein
MIRYMDFLNDLLFNKCDIETIKKKVLDYTTKENISLVAFFGFFSHSNDALILPEFQQLLLTCEANIPKDEVLEAFSAFDMNNNGSI